MIVKNAHTLYLNKLISGIFKIMHTAVLNYKIRNKQTTSCIPGLLYIPYSVSGMSKTPQHVLFLNTTLI
jgi:hypothetical protein